MNKRNYIKGILVNAFLGILLGIVTEFALIYKIKWLINITQSEAFWVLIVIIISIFSKNYLSTLINTSVNLVCMTDAYYIVRLIKSGYTNIGGIEWFGLLSVCVSFYFGTITFLIKDKIKNKRIENIIPKLNIIFMTLGVPIGWLIWELFIYNIHFQPIYCSEIGIIIGLMIGTIIGKFLNKKKKCNN